jgi:alpha-D-ribose 1-methylphosphonate 5-triphosphate synthase subunit PhnG
LNLSVEQLEAVCNILGETDTGLTKTGLQDVLSQCGIVVLDDGCRNNGYGYVLGQNKRTWLYNCLVHEISKLQNFSRIHTFIESALNPARYTME